MKRFTIGIVAGFVAALVAAPMSAAGMAPTYVSSEPSEGEELHRAPDRVEVTFSEPLDESSELGVSDSCGRAVDDGRVSVDGNTISVGITLKPSGHYEVEYRATGIAGVTGTTTGGFHFMVHLGKDCDGTGGGHRDHDGKKNGGSQHNEHGGSGGAGGHESGHDDGGSGEHPGSGHTSSGASTAHAGGSGHDRTDGKQGAHGKRHKGAGDKGKHRIHGAGHDPVPDEDPGNRTLAAGDGPPVAPDGRAVMLALGFSLALGVVGGWFLRISGAR